MKSEDKKAKKRQKAHQFKHPQDKNSVIRALKKTWHFIWYDDSMLSWLVNLLLAFIIIKFIIYPGLGLIFSTSFPIVAVVSESMEHPQGFDEWWHSEAYCGHYTCKVKCLCNQQDWYMNNNITKSEFKTYPFSNGFNKGDIMVLFGIDSKDVKIGQVIVFNANKEYPIIHRVIKIRNEEKIYFETKGDHNQNYINDGRLNEKAVSESQLLGKAVLRIPLLGYIKIWFTDFLVKPLFGLLH
ncbi:MAG: signal peptidase I [Nanoarchaeota archaeon]|nr:signal peptidase I [Nanoarchaeota archaeon]